MDDKELLVQISGRLKELREAKGKSAYQLSIDTGVNISRIERCERKVSVSSLAKVCSFLEVTLSEFFIDIELGDYS